MSNLAFFFIVILLTSCSESGYRKGHAGAQSSQASLNDPAGAELSRTNPKNSIVYGDSFEPPRNFESSVLNEPDDNGTNDAAGRGYRINGSGYGFKRD